MKKHNLTKKNSSLEIIEHTILNSLEYKATIWGLGDAIKEIKELTEEEFIKIWPQIYIDFNTSGKFVCLGENIWSLKEKYPDYWKKDIAPKVEPTEEEEEEKEVTHITESDWNLDGKVVVDDEEDVVDVDETPTESPGQFYEEEDDIIDDDDLKASEVQKFPSDDDFYDDLGYSTDINDDDEENDYSEYDDDDLYDDK
jgi:DNA-directed RNA polymerase subunit delta